MTQTLLKKKHAVVQIHSLSNTSKMPGKSWGINADKCVTGSKLATVEGTVCNTCYAQKGLYAMYPAVKQAQDKRLDKYLEDREVWRIAMASMMVGETYFRWFDSGDLQSAQMLKDIVWVAESSPWCNHWLATREVKFVKAFLDAGGTFPPNMVARISSMKFDVPVDNRLTPWSSMAHTVESSAAGSAICPAPKQGGRCGECRACWNPSVKSVSYHKH